MIPDNPVRTQKEDLLRRVPLARRIASMIGGYGDDESLVVGIEGEWGSGKTSFINLILEELNEEKFQIIKFNPWNFADQNELIKDFFSLIADVLKGAGEDDRKKIKKIHNYCAKLLKPSELRASIGIVNIGYKFDTDEPLEKQKEEINKILKDIKKRILIVIDDIDRLDSREVKLIFKLVKNTANFENTAFLLAYDRDNVSKQISEKGIEGGEFLKKIVQVSFLLPKLDPQYLFEILLEKDYLGVIIQSFDSQYWDQERWKKLFVVGLEKLFPTVRDIKRYVNSLKLDLEIVSKEEVNPIDFLGIEAIRVFAPKVYSAMAGEKQVFTETKEMWKALNIASGEKFSQEHRKEIYEEILEKTPQNLKDIIKSIIRQLFPQIDKIDSNTDDFDHDQKWRKQLRVCSDDMFDKYFLLAVPSGEISERSVKDLLRKADNVDLFVNTLREFQKENKFVPVLKRLPSYLTDLNRPQQENLLVGIFDNAEGIDDNMFYSAFDPQSPFNLIYVIALRILEGMEKEERADFLKKILCLTNNVFPPLQLISILIPENYGSSQEPPRDELFTTNDIVDLKKSCVEKIKKSAKDGTLAKSKGLGYILSRWKEWESEEATKDYVAVLLKTEEGLFDFLKGFVDEVHNVIPGESAKTERRINKQHIENFADIAEVEKKMNQLDESKLDGEKADLIKLYKNQHSKNPV